MPLVNLYILNPHQHLHFTETVFSCFENKTASSTESFLHLLIPSMMYDLVPLFHYSTSWNQIKVSFDLYTLWTLLLLLSTIPPKLKPEASIRDN